MLENPVELGGFFATQEISFLELCLQTCGQGPLRRQANGARGKIETAGLESRARPRPDVVAGSATRHTYRPARQLRVRRQKINQPRRRRPFFPGHVAGLVTALPVISAHVSSLVSLQCSITPSLLWPLAHRLTRLRWVRARPASRHGSRLPASSASRRARPPAVR